MTAVFFPFRGRPLFGWLGDRGTMARVVQNPSRPFTLSLRYLSFRISGAPTSLRVDDGGYHERDKCHLGGRAYTGNCFVLSHSTGVEYDTDIFTGDSGDSHAQIHAHVISAFAQNHIRSGLTREIYLTRII